jgi:hypothetical protein
VLGCYEASITVRTTGLYIHKAEVSIVCARAKVVRTVSKTSRSTFGSDLRYRCIMTRFHNFQSRQGIVSSYRRRTTAAYQGFPNRPRYSPETMNALTISDCT